MAGFDVLKKARHCILPAIITAASFVAPQSAKAGPVIVLGDSIGVGISMAAGVPRLAHNSIAIRNADAVRQVAGTPTNTIAIMSLGTNDAVGSISGVEKGIDRIIAASKRTNVRMVWVGPPCVLKRWNVNVQRLDAILRNRLADQVPYVSLADQEICDRKLRAADGVHFTMKGYAVLWARTGAAVQRVQDQNSQSRLQPVDAPRENDAYTQRRPLVFAAVRPVRIP